jgi:nitrogen regulatory protein P-II 1
MKKIEAVISPSKLGAVTQGLSKLGIEDISAVEIKESSRNGGRALVFRGSEFMDNFPPMTKFEIVVADEMVESAIGVIQQTAGSAEGMKGRIIVSTVEQCFHIRTQGREEKALHC